MQVMMQTMTIFWKINAHMIVEATSEVIGQSNLEFLMLIKVNMIALANDCKELWVYSNTPKV